jgi:hypothetical protein
MAAGYGRGRRIAYQAGALRRLPLVHAVITMQSLIA